MTPAPLPIDISPSTFQAVLADVGAALARHLEGLKTARAVNETDAAGARFFRHEDAPAQGRPLKSVLSEVIDRANERTFNTASGGYLAFVPGGGILAAALADLIKDVTNRYVGVYVAAPAYSEVEANVVRWFSRWVGLDGGSGFLTSGGSMANLAAMQVAHRRARPRGQLESFVGYTSAEAHHSVLKAFRLAGFPDEVAGAPALRSIATDARGRVDVADLQSHVQCDVDAGFCPAVIVGHGGTTNTGAVDDIAALAEVAKRFGAHLHVDAAYGGFFALTERGRAVLGPLDVADTLTLDPHKGLFLPYGTGCLLARDAAMLRETYEVHGAYMPEMQDDPQRVDFCNISPELSRPFRGLAIYLAMQLHGKDAFVAALDEKIDLARYAADALAKQPELDVAFPPELSLFAFTVRGQDGRADNARTAAVRDAVNAKGRVFMTSTMRPGNVLALRMCVLHFRTTRAHIDWAVSDIEDALAGSAAEGEAAQ